MITVRPMQLGEGAALLSMVRALAESHNLLHTVLATPEMFEAAMFSDQPIVGTLMAEYDGRLAGCAVWHRSFSTNRGAEVMYLEDLSVLPEFRRRGLMRLLLEKARDYIAASGAAEIRLETQLGHADAETYWRHLGFQPYRTLWRKGV